MPERSIFDGDNLLRGRRCAVTGAGAGIGRQIAYTLGGQGALFCGEGAEGRVPAAHVEAVDTVGAGDCFSAALAVALAEGRGLQEAVRWAVCAAGLSTEMEGAQPSMPDRSQIEQKLGCTHATH